MRENGGGEEGEEEEETGKEGGRKEAKTQTQTSVAQGCRMITAELNSSEKQVWAILAIDYVEPM